MPILLGLEVAAGVAVASALNSDSISSRFGSISSRVTSAASQAASLARSLVGDESVASPSSEETGSPVRVNLRVRSLRLPRLFAPEGPCGVLCGIEMLEQLSNAVPRRFGDASGQWHLLFSTDRDGTSLSHMLRRTVGAGPCLLILKDVEARIYGAYCSSLGEAEGDPSVGGAHYGSGETFLFAVTRLQLPSPPAGSTPGSAASEGRARLGVWTYRWTHRQAGWICMLRAQVGAVATRGRRHRWRFCGSGTRTSSALTQRGSSSVRAVRTASRWTHHCCMARVALRRHTATRRSPSLPLPPPPGASTRHGCSSCLTTLRRMPQWCTSSVPLSRCGVWTRARAGRFPLAKVTCMCMRTVRPVLRAMPRRTHDA
mmetsp:Transcript_33956/g.79494  ORF Transcript_33956/g.79494 Transcript_33956/m.79494 type:complete len:372 (+) Transcript_33956:113-1228(+)